MCLDTEALSHRMLTMQDIYDIFGEKGMAFLALEGTDVDMKAASDTLHGSTTVLTPTLSTFTLQAASHKMSDRLEPFEGMKRVHAAYKDPQYMVQSAARHPSHNVSVRAIVP